MKDDKPPYTDNVRPSTVNVNALRIVHASLPVRCDECGGRGMVRTETQRLRFCRKCEGRGSL